MQAAVFFDVSGPIAGRSAQVDGVLELRQTKPLPVTSAALTPGSTALIAVDKPLSVADVRLATLQSAYNARNC